jgi:hypothetical protein
MVEKTNKEKFHGFVVGTPIVANECIPGLVVFTSQLFRITAVTDTITHVLSLDGRADEVPTAELKRFGPAYSVTMIRAQGATWDFAYSVADVEAMQLRHLYTTLSRATKLSDVHFDFEAVRYKTFRNKPIKVGPTPLKINLGNEAYRSTEIYAIHDERGDAIYIGHTTAGITARFEQHTDMDDFNSEGMRIKQYIRAHPGECTIQLIQRFSCENLKAATRVETAYIALYIGNGCSLLNSKQLPKKRAARVTTIDVHKVLSGSVMKKTTWTDNGSRLRVTVYDKDKKAMVRSDYRYGGRKTRAQAVFERKVTVRNWISS